jgi:hypothetical protein
MDDPHSPTLTQLARAYGEEPAIVGQELRRVGFPGIPASLGKRGTPRRFPLPESITLGTYLWMRRRTPSSKQLVERAVDFAPTILRVVSDLLTGRRRSLGALVIFSPLSGPEWSYHVDDFSDAADVLRQAVETGTAFQVLPLLPILQPLMNAIGEATDTAPAQMVKVPLVEAEPVATMPGATANVPDVHEVPLPAGRISNVSADAPPGMKVSPQGIQILAGGVGVFQPMSAASFRTLAALATRLADEIERSGQGLENTASPNDPAGGGIREGAGVPTPAPSPDHHAAHVRS